MIALRHFLLVTLVAAGLLGSTTWAVDLEPPAYRGEPNSVMAKADLTMSPPTLALSEGANPTYLLSAVPESITGPVTTTDGLLYGVDLPNYIDNLPLKMMRVQYSWFGQQGDAKTTSILVNPNPPGGSIQLVFSSPIVPVPGTVNLFHRYDDFELRPNPDNEQLQVEFINADPQWLVIDTISIPEPSTVLLMGAASVLLVGVRSRHRNR